VINLFLEQFSRELAAGLHAVLVWDGAGYHTGGDLVVPANVSLIQLVPYSPELNPVENLWHYLRSHSWSLRVYRDYDALEEAAMAGQTHLIYGISAQNPLEIALVPRGSQPLPLDAPLR
jgi:transposase